MSFTGCPVVYKCGLIYYTVFTVPEYSTTITFSCVVNKFCIVNITICRTVMPVYCTTISSSSIVNEVRIRESCVVVRVFISMQVYCSTTMSGGVEHKPTVIYKSVISSPYNCTTVTLILFIIYYIT